MSGSDGKGGGRPPEEPPPPPVPGKFGGRKASGPPPRSETRRPAGGKRKRRSPTGVTPEGKAGRRDSPDCAAAAPETAGSTFGSGVPRPAASGSRSSSSRGGALPSPGGSPSASEPGWSLPGLWDPSGRCPRVASLSASPATDSASRPATVATRPVHSDQKTAARPETRPSPGRLTPSSPHPRSGALRLVGEIGSIDPRARGLDDPLPDPRSGSSPSSSHPPSGALGLVGEREDEETDREKMMRETDSLFSTSSTSDSRAPALGLGGYEEEGKSKTSAWRLDHPCRPPFSSSPRGRAELGGGAAGPSSSWIILAHIGFETVYLDINP